jgi:hypothetical protein
MKSKDQAAIENYVAGVAETVREIAAAIREGREVYRADDNGNVAYVDEYPLEVVAEVGRPFTVLVTCGGPHVEIVADGYEGARLVGHWGSEISTLWDDADGTFGAVLDYYTGRQEL